MLNIIKWVNEITVVKKMRVQEFIDRGCAPVELIFGGNRLLGILSGGAGVPLPGSNAFKSGRNLKMQRDRTGGG